MVTTTAILEFSRILLNCLKCKYFRKNMYIYSIFKKKDLKLAYFEQ